MDSIQNMVSALLDKRYNDAMAERDRVMAPGGWREVAGNLLSSGMNVMGSGYSPAALTLTPHMINNLGRVRAMNSSGKVRMFDINDDAGKTVGNTTIIQRNPKDLWVDWIGQGYENNQGPNAFGLREIRSLIPELIKHYPDAERVGGWRVSGARSNLINPESGWNSTAPAYGSETWMNLK